MYWFPKSPLEGYSAKSKRSAIYKNMTYQKHVVQKTQNIHYETIASKEILVNALLAVNWRELFLLLTLSLYMYSSAICLTSRDLWEIAAILWLSF